MTAQITELTPRRVTVDGGLVRITDLTSSDVDLLRILTSADDPEATVQRALAIGARALEVANASVDTAVVEASFENLRQRMSELVDAGQGQLTGTATELFDDPDTGVKAALARWSEQVQTLLEQTFDPARTDSAVGKLHLVLAESGDAQIAATRRMLNPDAEDSPLSRLAASMREQIATVLDALGRLAEQVSSEHAGAAATRAAMERSAVKGMAFEALVGRAVTDIAATRGDVAEPTGTTTGVTGGRVGDYVVEVADGGTYVLECKDRPRSLTAILAELDAAAANREAAAAIAIFSSTEHCPVTGPIAIFDDRVIVVYDKHDPDPAALTLACAWARLGDRPLPDRRR
jgi:hypothetical protein